MAELLNLVVRQDTTYDYQSAPGTTRETVIALLRNIADQIENGHDIPNHEPTVNDLINFNQWVANNGDAMCRCGHPLRLHRADLSSCGECSNWEPVFCNGFDFVSTGGKP